MSYVTSASAVNCVYYGSQAGGGFPGHPGRASHVRQSLFILYVMLPGGKDRFGCLWCWCAKRVACSEPAKVLACAARFAAEVLAGVLVLV